jgi:hypothetical protein
MSYTNHPNDPTTARIVDFLREIGLPVAVESYDDDSFLPGILVRDGGLVIDERKLLYPGDLLHEAGHLAVIPAAERRDLDADVTADMGDEIGAIAWSYAAALHIGIDPGVVFQPHGYKGSSAAFLDNFTHGRFVGVPLLQWMGLTIEEKNATPDGPPPFPRMVRWLRE